MHAFKFVSILPTLYFIEKMSFIFVFFSFGRWSIRFVLFVIPLHTTLEDRKSWALVNIIEHWFTHVKHIIHTYSIYIMEQVPPLISGFKRNIHSQTFQLGKLYNFQQDVPRQFKPSIIINTLFVHTCSLLILSWTKRKGWFHHMEIATSLKVNSQLEQLNNWCN